MISFSAPLQSALTSLRRHPWYGLILIVLQISFLLSIGFIGLNYQVKVMENLQTISTIMNSANLDEQQLLEGNAFLEQTLTLYSAYKSLVRSAATLIIGLLLVFILFQAVLWTLSQRLVTGQLHSLKQWLTIFGKYCLSTILFIIPLLLVSGFLIFLFVRYEFNSSSIGNFSNFFIVFAVILYYFLQITWALLPSTSVRQLPHYWWSFGVCKAYLFFPLIIFLHGFVLLWIYLVYILMSNNSHFLILLLTTIFFILSFLFTRLYFIQFVKLHHDHHHSH